MDLQSYKYFSYLCPIFHANWTRSSMDRIKDSGSFDWGSTPHGFTKTYANDLTIKSLAFLKNYLRNMNEIDNLPNGSEVKGNGEGLTINWVQLFIGAAICYFWFYENWISMLALAIVVIIHELGHVIAGKSFGCRIKEMQVFLLCFVSYQPKQIAGGGWWRDITWSLGSLPLGGFTVFDTNLNNKPAWQRLLISAGGVLLNFATFLTLYLALPFLPIGWEDAIWPVMSLSLILGVLNILPVYPLDGGSIIFACYEMATGKKPSQQFVNICGSIGFILIILFFWIFPEWIHGLLGRVFGALF